MDDPAEHRGTTKRGKPIVFPNGKRSPRGIASEILSAYRHVAKTKGPTKGRPDTEYEATVRLLKTQSIATFMKNMDQHEQQHLVVRERRRREAAERTATTLAGDVGPALTENSGDLIEKINRLLGEHDG